MATVVTNAYCEIETTVLRGEPYLLLQGDSVIAKMQTLNPIGWSGESLVNSVDIALIQVPPAKPSQAPTRAITSSYTQLVVDVAALTGLDTGGSPITSYHIQYDDSSNGAIWTDVIGDPVDSLALTATVSSSI